MENLQFGPRYCETPDPIGGLFPIETWNAYSSMVICVWGALAWVLVIRRAPQAWPLHVLCALLVLNGAGSTLWHGLRTRWALALDVQPALVFVALAAFLWARRVAPLWQAVLLVVVLVAAPFLLRLLPFEFGVGRIVLTAAVVILAAIWLVTRTFAVSRPAALTGLAALVLAICALTFRSIDTLACSEIGFGSHFLWHVTLSAAAFTLLLTLLRLEPPRVTRLSSSPVTSS
ncbi:hypothetical protein sos41_28630 [Alphaproteobacteria bacterium SO-S41]|nr:hypothetical protein sos41_28630 [Alphaproteobacteria bacterium SO-S41]